MKKLFLALTLVFLLASCGDTTDTPDPGKDPGKDPVDVETDTEAPVVTLVGDATITLEFGDTFTDPGATYTDNVDSDGDADVSGSIALGSIGSFELSYSKTDAAGNISNTVVRVVNVVDTVSPVLTLDGANTVVYEVFSMFTYPTITFLDNYDTWGTIVPTGDLDMNTLGTYTLSYTATDTSGNLSNAITQNVEVVDTTAPVLNVLGDINYVIGDGIPSVSNFVSATDIYDGDVIDSLDYTFSIGDYLSPGSYALTLTVSDSSGNTASEDINIIVAAVALKELGTEALAMVQGLAAMFTATPDEIILPEIGVVNSTILNIDDLTGNGYMDDEQIINSSVFNTLTAPEYIEIVEAYNGSLSTMQTYLSAILPLLANITEYEVEYTFSGFTFTMVKVNEEQYQVTVSGTIASQPVTIQIVIDELTLTGSYMYSIEFSTSVASWHYEIVRGLTGVQSIVEVKEFLGDNNGVLYVKGFFIDGDDLSGFILKDEANITRRLYFEFTDESKGIYYLNDDTGTEKYISLDENAELVFEYENYQPNVPLLGTEKVRWSLDKFTGITSIELSEGFIFDEFIINGDTNVDKSDSFDIEAKDYAVYLYDAVELEYSEETAGNWFLRIEGEYDTEFDSYFVFESFMIPMYTYDVKQHVLDMETNKDSFTLYGINVLEITKAEILAELDD